jgi:hypothetical protein
LIGLFGCSDKDIHEQIFDIPLFDSIAINETLDVTLEQGSESKIIATGDKELIDNLMFSVSNRRLTIDNNAAANWLHPNRSNVKIKIISNNFSEIRANKTVTLVSKDTIQIDALGLILGGKANLIDLNLKGDNFYYWNTSNVNAGTLNLKGEIRKLVLWNYSLMSVDAKELESKLSYIENHGDGLCEVYVSDTLEYLIKGYGDIHLYGKPQMIIEKELTSEGELIEY